MRSECWKWAAALDLAELCNSLALTSPEPFGQLIRLVFSGKLMSRCGRGMVLTWCHGPSRHRRIMWSGNAPVCLLRLILSQLCSRGRWNSHVTLFTSGQLGERGCCCPSFRANSSPQCLPNPSLHQLASLVSIYVSLIESSQPPLWPHMQMDSTMWPPGTQCCFKEPLVQQIHARKQIMYAHTREQTLTYSGRCIFQGRFRLTAWPFCHKMASSTARAPCKAITYLRLICRIHCRRLRPEVS